MKPNRKNSKITLSISNAQLIERLFLHGKVFEKLFLVLSVGAFGAVVGIFIGRASVNVDVLEANPNYEMIAAADTNRKPSSIPTVGQRSFFALQLSVNPTRGEAELLAKKNEKNCGSTLVRYSSRYDKYLVFCGNFSDRETAKAFASQLTEVKQVPMRLYLDSGQPDPMKALTACERLRE